jgi:hypothetical protein
VSAVDVSLLNQVLHEAQGGVYGGGLRNLEPKEVMELRLSLPAEFFAAS